MGSDAGKWMLIAGVVLVVLGCIVYFFHDRLGWIGHLPGDIRIEKEHFRFYFPITTLLLLNMLIFFIAWIIRKWNS